MQLVTRETKYYIICTADSPNIDFFLIQYNWHQIKDWSLRQMGLTDENIKMTNRSIFKVH